MHVYMIVALPVYVPTQPADPRHVNAHHGGSFDADRSRTSIGVGPQRRDDDHVKALPKLEGRSKGGCATG